jgi:3-dehydroquinate synthase II
MELWLDLRTDEEPDSMPEGVDRRINGSNIAIDGNKVSIEGTIVGAMVHIAESGDQSEAKSLIGSVSWLVLSFEEWSMIPLENLIAAAEGTPTRLAAIMNEPAQLQGAAFALEKGVDAIVVKPEPAMIEAAQICKSQRLERSGPNTRLPDNEEHAFTLAHLEITSVEEGGIGERYCIDFTSMLSLGEGMLVGSNASSFMLVHGETVPSEFVPSRPFRVNAGSPQSYTLMADGSTKYLAELKSGDSVTVSDPYGAVRHVIVGRLKIEQRPLLLFRWKNENDKEGHMFLQQAETVRAVDSSGRPVSVTSMSAGDKILGWNDEGARHIGVAISSKVSER